MRCWACDILKEIGAMLKSVIVYAPQVGCSFKDKFWNKLDQVQMVVVGADIYRHVDEGDTGF